MRLFPLALIAVCACGSAPLQSTTPSNAAATSGQPAPDATSARAAIDAMLDDFHDAASKADEARYFDHFTSDAVFLGTDATERWDVAAFREYAHPHFAKGTAWSFRAVKRHVMFGPEGRIAWFDEELATENLGPARGSGVVMLDKAGDWRIAHYNLTITVPNDRFDEVRKLLDGSLECNVDDAT